ncbi:hypothetical protein QQP08_017168 [Theobroma cacao]|nr:hypothetical protein QQP08_017168 [Theobroma cacao]
MLHFTYSYVSYKFENSEIKKPGRSGAITDYHRQRPDPVPNAILSRASRVWSNRRRTIPHRKRHHRSH